MKIHHHPILRSVSPILILIAICLAAATPGEAATSLWVADNNSHQVQLFDATSGASQGAFTSGTTLSYLTALGFGAGGSLYVGDTDYSTYSRIARFDSQSGAFLGDIITGSYNAVRDFVIDASGSFYVLGTSGVTHYNSTGGNAQSIISYTYPPYDPYSIALSPGNQLYITRYNSDMGSSGSEIAIYTTSGSPVSSFATGGDVNGPRKVVWDAAGQHYYSANLNDGNVRKFNASSNSLESVYTPAGGGAFVSTAIGPDGDIFVSSLGSKIFRIDGTTGADEGVFITGPQTSAMVFAPTPVPEPSTSVLLALGLCAGMWQRRKHPLGVSK